ncbi:hypothetical protein PENTCL1PPCAC_2296, partial [Pristionchus entomophagus]
GNSMMRGSLLHLLFIMLFDAPVDILDMRKSSLVSATRQLTRSASRSLIDAMSSMNTALTSSSSHLAVGGDSSTPKEVSPSRPAPFRRFYSSPQLIAKKQLSPQSSCPRPQSSSPPMVDSIPKSSPLPRNSVPLAIAQRMRLLSSLSLSLTNLEP